ncbi:hypothetical protein TL16_g08012 [Triparma laevis f. inornata]|uniref:Uncharacterized protein n=2 Tax=Triparma laevis TaxID=1534972 RepID=A0A9W7FUL6_9STRA|nr:hypothetical protein TL16_g08012 [Triparma laevis f. inornata]GMI18233.1 hypothetical protein TrLO_g7041 [Triparma laevis f. longispina]
MSKSVASESPEHKFQRKARENQGGEDEGNEDGERNFEVPSAESLPISTLVSTVPPPVDALINKLKEEEKLIEVLQFDSLTISTTVSTVPAMTSQFMFTDDFKRLLLEFVMGDTLMTLRLATKAWKRVTDTFIDKGVKIGELIVHDGKDISEEKADALEERRTIATRVIFFLNITKVGKHACADAINLIVVDIPEGVVSIDGGTFYNCESLTSVSFPTTLATIGVQGFDGCTSLENVDLLHTNLQHLGSYAFESCENLTSMTIPDSLQTIGRHVFWHCSKLVPSNIDVDYIYDHSDEDEKFLNYTSKSLDTTPQVVAHLRYVQLEFLLADKDAENLALKATVATLETENGTLKAKVEEKEEEVTSLKTEVLKLKMKKINKC